MPEITRFYGMVIKIFFKGEYNPPHFHVVYDECLGIFEISTLEMLEGDLPDKAQKLVKEWGLMYQNELMEMWNTKTVKRLELLK